MFCNKHKIRPDNLSVSLSSKGAWIVPALFAEQRKLVKAQYDVRGLLKLLSEKIDGTSLLDGSVIELVFTENPASDDMETVLVKMASEAEKIN